MNSPIYYKTAEEALLANKVDEGPFPPLQKPSLTDGEALWRRLGGFNLIASTDGEFFKIVPSFTDAGGMQIHSYLAPVTGSPGIGVSCVVTDGHGRVHRITKTFTAARIIAMCFIPTALAPDSKETHAYCDRRVQPSIHTVVWGKAGLNPFTVEHKRLQVALKNNGTGVTYHMLPKELLEAIKAPKKIGKVAQRFSAYNTRTQAIYYAQSVAELSSITHIAPRYIEKHLYSGSEAAIFGFIFTNYF